MPIHDQSRSTQFQSRSIQCQFGSISAPIPGQSNTIPVAIFANTPHPLPIRTQSSVNSQIPQMKCQSWTYPPIPGQPTNSMPIHCQSASPLPICQSNTNPPIQYQSANPLPIRQSITNMPIQFQSDNPSPIWQSITNQMTICGQSANLMPILNQYSNSIPILYKFANSYPICKYNANHGPFCQSLTNLSISDKSTYLMPSLYQTNMTALHTYICHYHLN